MVRVLCGGGDVCSGLTETKGVFVLEGERKELRCQSQDCIVQRPTIGTYHCSHWQVIRAALFVECYARGAVRLRVALAHSVAQQTTNHGLD